MVIGRCLFWILLCGTPTIDAAEASQAECLGGGRCDVSNGYYLAKAPKDWDGVSPLPLIVYFHGWNGSPEGTFRNRAMVNAANRRGALFVAPWAATGYWRQIGEGRTEGGRDELAYTKEVLADVRRRWPINEQLTLASGFSRGASMVWNLACYGGDLFTGFAPIAGGFWNDTPVSCPSGPVNLRHIHGLRDQVVAFDTIGVYNSMPIPEGLATLRRLNGCVAAASDPVSFRRYDCRDWSGCQSKRELSLCLHRGGHSIPAEWVAEGLDWLISVNNRR
jgi:polyhydroxybutyrate depolymerase